MSSRFPYTASRTAFVVGFVAFAVAACTTGGTTTTGPGAMDGGATSTGDSEDGDGDDTQDGGSQRDGGSSSGECTKCPKGCFDLDTDAKNCGSCGNVCKTTATGTKAVCDKGECKEVCPRKGEVVCGSECVDLETNPSYCGDCGRNCPAVMFECEERACVAGECAYPEKPVGTVCGGLVPGVCSGLDCRGGAVKCKPSATGYSVTANETSIDLELTSCSCQGNTMVGKRKSDGTTWTLPCKTECQVQSAGVFSCF